MFLYVPISSICYISLLFFIKNEEARKPPHKTQKRSFIRTQKHIKHSYYMTKIREEFMFIYESKSSFVLSI